MNKQQLAAVLSAAALTQLASCSKTDVTVIPNAESNTPSLTQSQPTAVTYTPGRQTSVDRIVEIDRFLSTPLTGTPEDSDQRAILRAERAALTGGSGNHAAVQNRSVAWRDQATQSKQLTVTQANGDIVSYGPAASDPNKRITFAPDSRQHDLPALSAMTPTERQQYYKYLRLTNPGDTIRVRH